MIKKSIIILCSLFMFSCSDEVNKPIDELQPGEPEELGHDIWHKVSFSFIEGKVSANGDFIGYKNDESLTFKTVQEYSFQLADDLTVKAEGQPIKLVKGNSYGLIINYYNKENKLMNNQFTTPEMAPIHQHFFVTSLKNSLIQKEMKVIDYVYRDTNITNKMLGEDAVTLRSENDPIGLKGYFKVFEKPKFEKSENKNPEDEFIFRTVLVHVLGKDKLDKNGKPFLFYQRTKLGNGVTDLDQKIPMKVFTDKDSSTFSEDVASEYGITKEQALEEINQRNFSSLKL